MQKIYLYRIALVAALAGLLFGLDLGVIAGALPFIKEALHLSVSLEGWVVSATLWGAAFGAIVSAWFSHAWGRKPSILISSLLFCLSSVGSALSGQVDFLIIMRVLLGISVGIATFNAPIYLAEISPSRIRGSLVTFYQFMVTLGILLAFLSDLIFTPTGAWRWMLGIIAIPAFIMFVLVCFLPESPRWLIAKGRIKQATKVLHNLLGKHEAQSVLQNITISTQHKEPIYKLLTKKPFLTIVLFGIGLQVIQQFSGMNAMLYYAPEIFAHAGYGSHTDQMWATFLIGLVNVITTIFAMRVIENLGRRLILYISGSMILFSTFMLGLIFSLPGSFSTFSHYAALFIVFIFIIGFALGYGPVVWTLCSEVFPLNGRAFAMSCATTSNWLASGLVGTFVLPIIDRVGLGNFYLILAAFAALSLLYFRLFVPETKAVPLEIIEKNLWQGKRLRQLGRS